MPFPFTKNSTPKAAATYLWCNQCRRSFDHGDLVDGACPVCHGDVQEMSRLSAVVRGVMANELVAGDIRTKHRQLVRLIWTRNGMGERYYRVLAPALPYNKFEARVTELLCDGARDGWVRFVLPPAPSSDEGAYRVEFDSEERFVQELESLFPPAET